MNAPVTPAIVSPVNAVGESPSAPTQTPVVEKHSLKVNGQVREVTLAELKQLASKASGSEERFNKASEIEKQSKELRDAFSSKDVKKLAASLGMAVGDVRAMLEDSLVPLIEEELLSPDERERQAKDRRLKEYEDRDLSEKEKREKAQHAREVQQMREQFDSDLASSLDKHGYANDPFIGGQVAQYLMSSLQEGYEISCDEATEIVVEKYQSDLLKQLSKFTPEQLKKHLPKDLHKALRESDVKSVKDAESIFTTSSKGVTTDKSTKPTEPKLSIKQAFEQLRLQNRKK